MSGTTRSAKAESTSELTGTGWEKGRRLNPVKIARLEELWLAGTVSRIDPKTDKSNRRRP